jgi:hypothetical protein
MIWKLLGALSGAALVGLWWLLVLEHPVLQPPAAADGPTRVEATVGPQPAGLDPEDPSVPRASVGPPPPAVEPSPQGSVLSADPLPVTLAAAPTESPQNQAPSESASPPTVPRFDAQPTPMVAATSGTAAGPSWHPLWNPFRSRASAQGFADHLSRLSDRRLRVEHQGPGQYRVLLAYRDETDLRLGLAMIEEVSGLSPEAPP